MPDKSIVGTVKHVLLMQKPQARPRRDRVVFLCPDVRPNVGLVLVRECGIGTQPKANGIAGAGHFPDSPSFLGVSQIAIMRPLSIWNHTSLDHLAVRVSVK